MLGRGARHLAALAVVALVGLVVSSAALAASPRQIFADYADNGRLDAAYTRADLEAALQNATIQGYSSRGNVAGMKTEIKRKLGGGAPAGAQGSLGASGSGGGTLPFTGFDLALIVGGALFLLAIGGGLRRVSRARS
jgi:opacity protein-like surface antigen